MWLFWGYLLMDPVIDTDPILSSAWVCSKHKSISSVPDGVHTGLRVWALYSQQVS